MHKHRRPKGTGALAIPEEAVEAAAQPLMAIAWDEAIQLADDEGCLLYHQTKGLKSANPYRTTK